ncbi:MAG: hypothetical protein E7491_08275 [Ruminococcaceae bacterium]|nr:hypothetical protein [Oscillospiraceae bacterium]
MQPILTDKVYYVGPTREYKSITRLFLDLASDSSPKTVYIDAGVYDIFREYKEANVPSPPDDVKSPDYFTYNVFLPLNTNLIGIGNVVLTFCPSPDEITYGESRTWSPLNIVGACHIENIEIRCKNGRYCIHDDGHNANQNTSHTYKHVRCVYEMSDIKDGKRLGFNKTVGNGMAQGTKFEFEDCTFQFAGGNQPAFYTHEDGRKDPENSPSLIFKHCLFLSSEDSDRALFLQNLATADLHILTRIESCCFLGGIYLHIYRDESAQHFDVTLINSGNPKQHVDREEENRYPIKVY